MSKSRDAFRTISEVSAWLDTPAHVLRFWESKFSQIKPVKRAGGRRYYRPQDMDLLSGIKKLLHDDGMTIKGVQKLLREKGVKHVAALGLSLDDSPAVDSAKDVTPPMAAPTPVKASKNEASITNVVPLPHQAINTAGPSLTLNLNIRPSASVEETTNKVDATPDKAPKEAARETPKIAPKTALPNADLTAILDNIPADPADASSKANARIFNLFQKTPAGALSHRKSEIIPIVARLETLRNRINLR